MLPLMLLPFPDKALRLSKAVVKIPIRVLSDYELSWKDTVYAYICALSCNTIGIIPASINHVPSEQFRTAFELDVITIRRDNEDGGQIILEITKKFTEFYMMDTYRYSESVVGNTILLIREGKLN